MAIAGLVLIVASILKAHQLLSEPIISTGFWESWAFFVIQIPLELGLGIWLVSGLFKKAAWLIVLMAFALFIGVTLQKTLAGAESCGCFGTIHVKPWITLSTIDIPLFLGLLIFRPRKEKLLPPPWPSARHFFGVAIPTFILLGAIVPILIFNKPPEKTSRYEVVRPDEWISKPWPLLQYIDIADSLRSQIAIVLLYHSDCPNCREAIPKYEEMARDLTGNENAIRIAFIEVPPYGSPEDNPVSPDTICLAGKLASTKQWYNITTPLIVALVDGSVVKYWEVQTPSLDQILDAVFSAE